MYRTIKIVSWDDIMVVAVIILMLGIYLGWWYSARWCTLLWMVYNSMKYIMLKMLLIWYAIHLSFMLLISQFSDSFRCYIGNVWMRRWFKRNYCDGRCWYYVMNMIPHSWICYCIVLCTLHITRPLIHRNNQQRFERECIMQCIRWIYWYSCITCNWHWDERQSANWHIWFTIVVIY